MARVKNKHCIANFSTPNELLGQANMLMNMIKVEIDLNIMNYSSVNQKLS